MRDASRPSTVGGTSPSSQPGPSSHRPSVRVEDLVLAQRPDELLDEERVSGRALDDPAARGPLGRAPEDVLDELADSGLVERLEANRARARARALEVVSASGRAVR